MDKTHKEKFRAFYDLLQAISPDYRKSSDKSYQSFIETTLGAALFYLPQNKELHFSGMISESAKKLKPQAHTKDHYFPRKWSARQLLSSDHTLDEVIKLCNEQFLRYHLITKTENKQLVQFQKVTTFETPEKSYEDAGIVLVPLEEDEEE